VWKRPGLTPRDRSLVTIAALIARDQSPALPYYSNQAIENGVNPREISETITHVAFYAGWANAFAAVGAARDVFGKRRIGADQLPPATVEVLPLDEAAEADRANRSPSSSARSHQASFNTPQTFCSGISGGVPT
jgi:4-carboxymuconolactone decarboxylase